MMTMLEGALVTVETSSALGCFPATRLSADLELIFILPTSSTSILSGAAEVTGQVMLCLGKLATCPPSREVR